MSFARPALSNLFQLTLLLLGGALGSVLGASACAASDPVDGAEDDAADEPAETDEPPPEGDSGGPAFEVEFVGEGVECGDESCKDAQIVGQMYGAKGCCFDDAESACGLDMSGIGLLLGLIDPGCEQLDAPGSADDSCPDSAPVYALISEAPAEGVTLPGCCRSNGTCGFSADFGSIGFGCVDPEEFAQEPSGSCDYER